MSWTDSDCVRRCLDGQPDAFRQLVQRYHGPLMGFLAGRLASHDMAEEAAQESLVRAYFSLSKLRKPESFYSWLLGIAGRVGKEFVRARRRQLNLTALAAERPRPEHASHGLRLEAAVAELPEPYRKVILLRYYGGNSCAQVAEELGLPIGTVTKQLSRAYGLLREALRDEQGGSGGVEVQL